MSALFAGRRAALLALLTVLALLLPFTSGKEMLTAHIIAHSHCDPGWLDTFHDYYRKDVRRILDGVLDALSANPSRRFIWAESSFFSLWWEQQPLERKTRFKALVAEGRLEFVGGGWVQNDEANPDYVAVINQMTTGHEYLMRNFGVTPRIGWQIDPFGHSEITPSLFALLGFDAMVVNRIHYSLKTSLKQSRDMEFVWRGVDLGEHLDMYTHVLHTHYSAPKGFDWEEGSIRVSDRNVADRAQALARELLSRAGAYRSPHLLVPFGDDFKFKNANLQFENMDRVIAEIQRAPEQYGVRVRYSTLSEYFDAVRASNTAVSMYQGDFFPYADNYDSYWTGYFTTRPFLKATSRRLLASLHRAELLYAASRSRASLLVRAPPAEPDAVGAAGFESLPDFRDWFEALAEARRESALFLHHDAITGTARRRVVEDYVSRMSRAEHNIQQVARDAMDFLMAIEGRSIHAELPSLEILDAYGSGAPTTGARVTFTRDESRDRVILMFNPLAWERPFLASVQVNVPHVRVRLQAAAGAAGGGGQEREEAEPLLQQVEALAGGGDDGDADAYVLRFLVTLPPLGVVSVVLEARPDANSGEVAPVAQIETLSGSDSSEAIEISNAFLTLRVDPRSGMTTEIVDVASERVMALKQTMAQYSTTKGGAYLFRPTDEASEDAVGSLSIRVIRGAAAERVEVARGPYTLSYTLAKSDDARVGSFVQQLVSATAQRNRNVVLKFQTDVAADGRIWNHNSLEFVPRQLKTSSSGSLDGGRGGKLSEIASNFYPCIYGGRVEPKDTKASAFTFLSTHSMSCGTRADGEIEVLLHRNLGQDDGRGMAEAAADDSRMRVELWLFAAPVGDFGALFAGSTSGQTAQQDSDRVATMNAATRINNPPLAAITAHALDDAAAWFEARPDSVELLQDSQPFPAHVHLLSLFARDGVSDDVAVRLHSFSLAEAPFKLETQRLRFGSVSSSAANALDADGEDEGAFAGLVRSRPASLTLVLNVDAESSQRLHFPELDSMISFANVDFDKHSQDGQNSEEEGVFIAKAALDRKDGGIPPPGLLEEEGGDDDDAVEKDADSEPAAELHPPSRKAWQVQAGDRREQLAQKDSSSRQVPAGGAHGLQAALHKAKADANLPPLEHDALARSHRRRRTAGDLADAPFASPEDSIARIARDQAEEAAQSLRVAQRSRVHAKSGGGVQLLENEPGSAAGVGLLRDSQGRSSIQVAPLRIQSFVVEMPQFSKQWDVAGLPEAENLAKDDVIQAPLLTEAKRKDDLLRPPPPPARPDRGVGGPLRDPGAEVEEASGDGRFGWLLLAVVALSVLAARRVAARQRGKIARD